VGSLIVSVGVVACKHKWKDVCKKPAGISCTNLLSQYSEDLLDNLRHDSYRSN
jgi:hypothetical protein